MTAEITSQNVATQVYCCGARTDPFTIRGLVTEAFTGRFDV